MAMMTLMRVMGRIRMMRMRMLVLRRIWMMRTVVLRMRADLDWCFSWPGLEACRRPFWLDVADPGGEGGGGRDEVKGCEVRVR